MEQKDNENEMVEVYLFSDPEPEIGKEQNNEIDDRPMELISRINAFFAKRSIKHDLLELDVVISSGLLRAQEIAKILADKSVNTPKKQKVRRHFGRHMGINTEGVVLNVIPNDEYQPVLVISDINHKIVAQLTSAIEALLPGTKMLIVMDSENLHNLTQTLIDHEIKQDLNFSEGVKITLGKNREISSIRHKIKI